MVYHGGTLGVARMEVAVLILAAIAVLVFVFGSRAIESFRRTQRHRREDKWRRGREDIQNALVRPSEPD
jgi:uncharacterized membrane-anchored protein